MAVTMRKKYVDILPNYMNPTDFEANKNRGNTWGIEENKEDEKRREFTFRYFYNNSEADVFRIARSIHLPILVVRQIKADVHKVLDRNRANE